jgi:hypothetical protein
MMVGSTGIYLNPLRFFGNVNDNESMAHKGALCLNSTKLLNC